MPYLPGSTVTRQAQFFDENLNLVDPNSVVVDVVNESGVVVLNDGIATRISLGTFQFSHLISLSASNGIWKFAWVGDFGSGQLVEGIEEFVVSSSTAYIVTLGTSELISKLRNRLYEIGENSLFSNDQINEILITAGNDLDAATIEGWVRKCAVLSELIDISESGSERELSQRFKNAKSMLDWWTKFVSEASVFASKAVYRPVVGKVASLRECPTQGLQTPFSGYSEHIREYPTHRLIIPAILTGVRDAV